MPRPVVWTNERIIAALRETTQRLGHVPTSNELWSGKIGCPALRTICSHFGSVRQAIIAAGLTPRAPGGPVKHGRRRRCVVVPLPPICPKKAAAITEAKRDYWLNGGRVRLGRSEWVHPYAWRVVSRSAAPASTATPDVSSRRTA